MSAVLVEDGPDKGAVWHFGEPVKEQRALEAGTAWADLSQYNIIAVSGVDRLQWLHDLTTQFVSDLEPGLWKSNLILDARGHIEFQFNVVDDGDNDDDDVGLVRYFINLSERFDAAEIMTMDSYFNRSRYSTICLTMFSI